MLTQQSTHSAFVYGSLLVDRVVHFVLSRVPAAVPAVLPRHARRRLRERHYPGVTENEHDVVCGKLLIGLSSAEVALLDDFEGDEYVRKQVHVLALPATFYADHRGACVESAQRLLEANTFCAETACGGHPQENPPALSWVQTSVYIYQHSANVLPGPWRLSHFLTEVDDFLRVEREGAASEI